MDPLLRERGAATNSLRGADQIMQVRFRAKSEQL